MHTTAACRGCIHAPALPCCMARHRRAPPALPACLRSVDYLEKRLFCFTIGRKHEAIVDWLHVENLVEAALLAAKALGAARGHVAAGQAYFVHDDQPGASSRVNQFEFLRPLIEGLGYPYPRLSVSAAGRLQLADCAGLSGVLTAATAPPRAGAGGPHVLRGLAAGAAAPPAMAAVRHLPRLSAHKGGGVEERAHALVRGWRQVMGHRCPMHAPA